jgi:hypothetical protein
MASTVLDHLMKEIQELDPTERAELRRRLDSLSMEPTDVEKLRELDRRLFQEGLLSRINPVDESVEEPDAWQPIAVSGKPLSETLVEERR